MMRSTAKSFYQRYFSATQEASWLARLMAGRHQDAVGGDSLTPELGIADIMCD